MVEGRGAVVSSRMVCYYCSRNEAMREAGLTDPNPWVVVTVHDQRGCYDLCWSHALWRQKTSAIGGHSKDCPRG